MVVLTISKCPPALRGDLTKWLFEVSTGVYVGRVNARVREQLWKRIKASAPNGQATMVWNTNNEQGLDFRIHNSLWEPIDFDGLKLMMRPNLNRQKQNSTKNIQSNARTFLQARNKMKYTAPKSLSDYIVIDIETTGLMPDESEIIEFGALRIVNGEIIDEFAELVVPQNDIPDSIQKLTGITMQVVKEQGTTLENAFNSFCNFIGEDLLVAHNVSFDLSFLNKACAEHGRGYIGNKTEDTFKLSKKLLYNARSHKLGDIAQHLGIQVEQQHRALVDCHIVFQVYEKLKVIKLNENGDIQNDKG